MSTKTKRAYTRPSEPRAHKPNPPRGSGPVFEIWQNQPEPRTQQEFAALVGVSAETIRLCCVQNRTPKNVHARAVLLSMALAIPEKRRSIELDTWIAEQQARFEERPAPGVFL